MSFDLFVDFIADGEAGAISKEALRSLFPVVKEVDEFRCWEIRYDERNSCDLYLGSTGPDVSAIQGFSVSQPCADHRLWEGLAAILRMGSAVIYWPGSPPIVGTKQVAAKLPEGMEDSLGPARVVTSADELIDILKES